MIQKLTDFLTQLATDEELAVDYEKDAEATMQKYGVSEEHIALILAQKFDEIQSLLGDSLKIDINMNGIILPFKK